MQGKIDRYTIITKKYRNRIKKDEDYSVKIVAFVYLLLVVMVISGLLMIYLPFIGMITFLVGASITLFKIFNYSKLSNSVRLSKKDNQLFRLSYAIHLILNYLTKREISDDLNNSIKQLNRLDSRIRIDNSINIRTGFEIHRDINNFFVRLRLVIKNKLIPTINKEENLEEIVDLLEKIFFFIENEKFREGVVFFKQNYPEYTSSKGIIISIWEWLNNLDFKEDLISLALTIFIAILVPSILLVFTDINIAVAIILGFTIMSSYEVTKVFVKFVIRKIDQVSAKKK